MYLSSMGYNTTKSFRCINPDHQDKNPSCGLVPATDNEVFHCHSCLMSGNVFTAAHFLEGKPLSGRGFIQENLMYLAQKFGEPIPDLPELTEEDLFDMDVRSAYVHAGMVIKSSEQSSRVKAKIMDLGWPRDVRNRIGVGSVTSFQDYVDRMTHHYGHSEDFLKKVDLCNPRIFNENCLIYTIRDENGAPVGFQSRDLLYDDKIAKYKAKVQEIEASIASKQEKEDLVDRLFKPTKFTNTSDACPIYQKSRRLFNLDQAKKYSPPLWAFEGNSDVVTCAAGGMWNTSAICSTSFTADHLDLIIGLGIKHIIFCMDADQAGGTGVDRFVKMLEERMGNHVGLKVEIVVLPDGTDDPDKFVRSFGDLKTGVKELRGLPRTDMFAWSLKKRLQAGAEPLAIAEETIPLIVNEPNNLLRMGMTKRLSESTGLDETGLWKEVMRQVDIDRAGAEEEKLQIARRIAKELTQHPERLATVLEQGRINAEGVEKRKSGYDPRKVIAAVQFQHERSEKNTRHVDLVTGYPELDAALGGIPFCDTLISLPGKPSHSKTSSLENLCWHLIENNDNTRILFHGMDDSINATQPRIMATKFCKPTNWFKRAGYYRSIDQEFDAVYAKAKRWFDNLIETERLILADVTILPAAIAALEVWVRSIRSKFPNDSLIVMGDNFAQYQLPGFEGERLDREKSMALKRIANEYHVTIMVTTELPKGSLKPGIRPRMHNIKGTSGIAYDVNANIGVYNDLKDLGEASELVWAGPMETITAASGENIESPRRMPIIELVIDKSKLSSFDGSIFYRLDPESGHMDECPPEEQSEFREKVAATSIPNAAERPSYATRSAF